MKRLIQCIALLLFVTSVQAQNTITFIAETVTGIEVVSPILTWSTSPPADTCVASGSWTGDKGASGNETLPDITSDATYNLSCGWFAGDSVTLSWTPPTQNTDGTALIDLVGYVIYYGTATGSYPLSVTIDNPSTASYVISPLAVGDWFFVATSFNTNNIESEFSNEAMKTIAGAADSKSIGITVNARPNPPAGLGVL